MKTILANAFSLQMLNTRKVNAITTKPLSIEEVRETLAQGFTSAVGHADTARILSNMLDTNIEAARVNVSLDTYTQLIVAQVIGGRLPEGCTELPEGIEIQFLQVVLY